MAPGLGGRAQRRLDQRRQHLKTGGLVGGAVLAVVLVVGGILVLTRSDGSARRVTQPSSDGSTTSSSSATTSSSASTVTTVVPRSTDPVVALAQQYDGLYKGTFTNTTFNTSGPATLELRIDPTAATLDVVADFNGDVFGGGAKELRRINTTVQLKDPSKAVATDTKSFGKVTGSLDAGLGVVLTAPNVPDPKVLSYVLTGMLRADKSGFDATYRVVFEDGTTADGTVTVTCAPNGQRPSEVRTLCTPL
jgi:hypothetical protein